MNEPGRRQLFEFSLRCAKRGARLAHDLTEIVGLVRVTQKPPEHAPTRAAEKNGCRMTAVVPIMSTIVLQMGTAIQP